MSKRALLLSVAIFVAVAISAKVYIPLVKSVPPGTAGGGAARVGIRTLSYDILAYYENDTLYIEYPSDTVSKVVIIDEQTRQRVIDYTFNGDNSNVNVPIGSLSLYNTYYVYINVSDDWWAGYFNYLPFIQEQQITLTVGESYQLHVTPANAKVIWMGEPWILRTYNMVKGFRDHYIPQTLTEYPVSIVDDNGLVTALKTGNTVVFAESLDGSIREQCQITVCERTEQISKGVTHTSFQANCGRQGLSPVSECEWEDVKFSLSENGSFEAEGTFYGSGTKDNVIYYVKTDQCIFVYFDIDYSDSTEVFYPQPFKIQINDCTAHEYTVYFRNSTGAGNEQEKFIRYNITNGSSADDNSGQTGTDITDSFRDIVYPLNLDYVEVPNRMFIKKEPDVTKDYVISLLEEQFNGNYRIDSWTGDIICKVYVDDSLIDNAVAELIQNDSVVMARRIYVTRENYDRYLNSLNSILCLNLEYMELCIYNEISYGIKRGNDQLIMDSLANVFGLVNEPSIYDPEWMGKFIVPKTIDYNNLLEISRALYETGCFTSISPDFHMKILNGYNDNDYYIPNIVKNVHSNNNVIEITHYNLSGQKTNNPSGLTIVVTRYSDGTVRREKKLFLE
jgi:hypothetical protein